MMKKLLILSVLLVFIGCQKTKTNDSTLPLFTTPMEDGFKDFQLQITDREQSSVEDMYFYTAQALYGKDTLSIRIGLKLDIKKGIDETGSLNPFVEQGISFESLGNTSDNLLQVMAKEYGLSSTNLKLQQKQLFNIANLNDKDLDYKTSIARFKIFLEREDNYAEMFVNFDFDKNLIYFSEKDSEYRQSLIDLLKQ